jgi:hypothetical protein
VRNSLCKDNLEGRENLKVENDETERSKDKAKMLAPRILLLVISISVRISLCEDRLEDRESEARKR